MAREERYSNTKATVNTAPWGGLGQGGHQNKTRLYLPWASRLPGTVGLALGSWVSLCELLEDWVVRRGWGACGWGLGRRGADRGSGEGTTRTTPSWK